MTVDVVKAKSQARFAEMIRSTVESGGTDVALLACTELSLLQPEQQEVIGGDVLVLDTVELHALAAVDFMLADS